MEVKQGEIKLMGINWRLIISRIRLMEVNGPACRIIFFTSKSLLGMWNISI